ncbi:hypothetical protein SVIOM342S_01351 [Streptomyces violaceorubidus]
MSAGADLLTGCTSNDPDNGDDKAAADTQPAADDKPGKPITIGYAGPQADHGWLNAINDNAKKRAEKYSEVTLEVTKVQNNTAQQISQIETLINKKVDVLVVLPADGKALTQVGLKAMRAGIPVINLDRIFNSPQAYRCWVGGDNYGMGLNAAHYGVTGQVTVDDRRRVHRPPHLQAPWSPSRPTRVRQPAARTPCASNSTASAGSLAFDLEQAQRAGVPRRHRARGTRRFPADPRHRTRTPLPGRLVAAGPRARLQGATFVHQARDLVHAVAEGRGPEPSFADGLQVQRVLAAVEESAEKNSVYTPILPEGGRQRHATQLHALHRTVGGPAAGGGLPPRPRLRLRRPGTGLLGRPLRGRQGPGRPLLRGIPAPAARQVRPQVLGRLQPPGRPGRLRRHHRRTPRGDPAARIWGDGDAEGVRQRAAAEIKDTARAAARLGVDTVIGFTGSAIWHLVAMFPPAPASMIERGYQELRGPLNPILDVFDAEGVRFAHEVHQSEIAYDYWTTQRALEAVDHRPAFGLNFDPSHFVSRPRPRRLPVGLPRPHLPRRLQGGPQAPRRPQRAARLPPAVGRPAARLGLRVGRARRRPWKGCVFRMLRFIDYQGPVSVEWEDAGMDRVQGAPEALSRLKAFDFEPPSASFDAAFENS